ncbi:MAG: hypothetical protein LRY50_04590, partial [Geovibrio sp.]|nr:hypothetical protein [Geovibrio sp.]
LIGGNIMNALAKELNEIIAGVNPAVYEMLSDLGKNIYMPKGIITQRQRLRKRLISLTLP